MTYKDYFKTSIVGLKTNKTRSFLTILGIVIGIASIILIVSLGRGAQTLILSQVEGLGSKTIIINPGRDERGSANPSETDSLRDRDLDALRKKSNVPNIEVVIPNVVGSLVATYENNIYQAFIYGSTPDIGQVVNAELAEGVFITDEDVDSNASVVVIGSKTKEELFEDKNAVGERIKIKNKTFKVIGVTKEKGSSSFINFDDGIIMPYTTAQNYIFGIKYFNSFFVVADDEKNIQRAAADILTTLRDVHDIDDPKKDNFTITNQADIAARLSTITSALTYFLSAVAAISLMVGGIGIMNIMLVSVTERTREIGLRKAVGATTKNILIQFLFESVTLTLIGGLIGVILGWTGAFLASLVLSQLIPIGWEFVFPVSAALLGIGVSALVGLTFGLYPARQASKKSPIEALRYE